MRMQIRRITLKQNIKKLGVAGHQFPIVTGWLASKLNHVNRNWVFEVVESMKFF